MTGPQTRPRTGRDAEGRDGRQAPTRTVKPGVAVTEPHCAVCGRSLDPNEVADFVPGSEGVIVCDDCQTRYSDELEEGTARARAAYLDEMRDFGER